MYLATGPSHCFNEAAGIPRGRREAPRVARRVRRASMRPRVFPAEDSRTGWSAASPRPCFNEAAGIPRGRLPDSAPNQVLRPGFNEAAGIPRGRLAEGRRDGHLGCAASMRPRVFPAEDSRAAAGSCRARSASMRPRVFPAEDAGHRSQARYRDGASMRPRVFPAEDLGAAQLAADFPTRFNEAAGIPRGRQPGADASGAGAGASMRPRVFPAEDAARLAMAAVPALLQ